MERFLKRPFILPPPPPLLPFLSHSLRQQTSNETFRPLITALYHIKCSTDDNAACSPKPSKPHSLVKILARPLARVNVYPMKYDTNGT